MKHTIYIVLFLILATSVLAIKTELQTPLNSLITNSTNVTFLCNASDETNLKNITLYENFTGTWRANESYYPGKVPNGSDVYFLYRFDNSNKSINGSSAKAGFINGYEGGYFAQGVNLTNNTGTQPYLQYSSESFDYVRGSIEMWVYINWDGTDTKYNHYFFDAFQSGSNNMKFWYKANRNDIICQYDNAAFGGGVTVSYDVSHWNANEWHFIACSWSASDMIPSEAQRQFTLFVDGVNTTQTHHPSPLDNLPANFYIGNHHNIKQPVNSIVDDFRITSTFRTTAQFNKTYQDGIALKNGTATFKPTLTTGNYLWNCFSEDNESNIDFNNNNYTLTINPCLPPTHFNWYIPLSLDCLLKHRSEILNYNIAVYGNLTLENTNISLNNTNENQINVFSGGKFNSTINNKINTTTNNNATIKVNSGSNFYLQDSIYQSDYGNLDLQQQGVIIKNQLFDGTRLEVNEDYTVVDNCTFNNSKQYAIKVLANYSNFTNNYILNISADPYFGTPDYDAQRGFDIRKVHNNTFTNNTIWFNLTTARECYYMFGSEDNNFKNEICNLSSIMFTIKKIKNNVFNNLYVYDVGTCIYDYPYGLITTDSANRVFVEDTDFTSCVSVFNIVQPNTNFTFLNVSYTGTPYTEAEECFEYPCIFTNKWYLDVYTNSTNGNPLQNVNVTGYNVSNYKYFSDLTQANGYITRQNVTEFVEKIWSGKTYHTPYTINATYKRWNQSKTTTLTTNTVLWFVFDLYEYEARIMSSFLPPIYKIFDLYKKDYNI